VKGSRRSAVKTAVSDRGPPVVWRDVLRVVQDEQTRSEVVTRFRASGFTADDFGHERKAREALTETLVWVEDKLESRGYWTKAERAQIRGVRRRLELELWP
jgi:hypothetical protein